MSEIQPGRGGARPGVAHQSDGGPAAIRVASPTPGTAAGSPDDAEARAAEFVRFCYRRRSVGWPELYDEMCAVAAGGAYRGMGYEQLEDLGIGFALGSLPRLARMSQRIAEEERGRRSSPGADGDRARAPGDSVG